MPGERAEQAQREDGKPHAGGPGRLTHAERVIDPASGLTKGDLARYYVQAAPLMRPYLKGRPVSLVRAPSGIGGDLFSSATWMPRCPARVCCRSPCIRGIRPCWSCRRRGRCWRRSR